MSRSYTITTAIDYVNALPHLGTAYEKIGADALARFHRMKGEETFFLMGTDEHSLNVEKQARAAGLKPQTYCDGMVERFEEVWQRLNVSYDRFIRTSEPDHVRAVREMLALIHEKGDIYKGRYKGWYCVSCEAFLREKDLREGVCPSHGTRPEWIEEENYFFRLSRYREPLLALIRERPGFIRPEIRRNEILNLVEGGLEDVSVSRSSVEWGIPLPFAEGQVVYVWFDALINYISGAGFGADNDLFRRRWPADLHVIGKDITRFHCVIWPAMLMSAGIELPRGVFGHGFVSLGGEKMSKTRGTSVDPLEAVKRLGADPLRYFLLREIPFDRDGDFTWEKFNARYNADLANDLGNLLQRVLKMVGRYVGGRVPDPAEREATGLEGELRALLEGTCEAFRKEMDACRMNRALEAVWDFVRFCNRYVERAAPWAVYKAEGCSARLETVLYALAESQRAVSVLIHPFMPETSSRIRSQLGLVCDDPPMLSDLAGWGRLPAGGPIGKPEPLFPRLE